MDDELFTTRLRTATRKVHAISDSLVNAKLLFALSSNEIWSEGLLVFYEIFKFLENAMREKKNENLGKLYMEHMNRTSAFENDLTYYLGNDWKKNYKIRDSVKQYLDHLENLKKNDSDFLMVYVYHLYMGLLSGGQILRKKRRMSARILKLDEESLKEGETVTDYEGKSMSDLKYRLRNKMNEIAETLDENKKELLIKESIKVFELNNLIIKSVRGTNKVALKNFAIFISMCVAFLALFLYSFGLFLGKI